MHLRKLPFIAVLIALIIGIPVLAAPVGKAASDRPALTRAVVDFYSAQTGQTRRVERWVPASSLPGGGRPQFMPPSPSVQRNPQAMARFNRMSRTMAQTGLDQPGRSPATLGRVGSPKAPVRVSGTWQAIVLLVDFTDQSPITYTGTAGVSHFQDLMFSSGIYATGSMRDYYKEVSSSLFEVNGLVTGGANNWYRAPHSMSYYAGSDNGTGSYPNNCQKMVEDVVDAADSTVDFADYDNDNDGYVDALFVLHAGRGAETSGSSSDIWSHKWQINPRLKDGKYIYVYSTEPEDGKVGVFAHEFGHVLGLPDLYDTDYSSQGVGLWCLMAAGSYGGDYAHSERPVHMSAWCKAILGWVNPINIDSNQDAVTIPRTETSPTAYMLWKDGTPGFEYFMVENRQRTGFDQYLRGTGLLIYHIDERMSGNAHEWYPGRPRLLPLSRGGGAGGRGVRVGAHRDWSQ